MKKMGQLFFCIFIMAMCLSGCAGDQRNASNLDVNAGDWRTKGFTLPAKEASENLLWSGDFLTWEEESIGHDSTKNLIASASHENTLYRFASVFLKNGDQMLWDHWSLESWNPISNEKSERKFSQEDLLGKEANSGRFKDIYVTGSGNFTFWWEEISQTDDGTVQPVSEKLLFLEESGTVKMLDLTEELSKRDMMEKELRCLIDGSENIFIMSGGSPGNAALYVFDMDYKKLTEWSGGEEASFSDIMQNEDGEYIFVIWNVSERAEQFYYFDKEQQTIRCLAQLGGGKASRRYLGMYGDRIYYQSEQFIYEWNVASGRNEKRFDIKENGISTNYQVIPVFSKDGELSYLWFQSQNSFVTKLSAEKKEKDALKVVDLLGNRKGSSRLSDSCSEYMQNDLNHLVSYKAMSTQEGRDRTFAQLLSGEGPDLLYVSRADFEILSKLGVLTDLRELISEETLQALLPGAIAIGTVNEKLLGIPGMMNAFSIWVPDRVWSESTWTLEDVIELLDTHQLVTCCYYPALEGFYWPFASVRILTKDWQHSFLYDEESRECHFDDERFLKLLKIEKATPKPDDADTWYENEDCMINMTISATENLRTYGLKADLENAHIVGYPTTGGNGSFLDTDGCLVVNVKSTHKKEISEFLEVFLSEKVQNMEYGLSSRKYPLEKLIPDSEGRYWFKASGMKEREELFVYEDGTTPVHRAEAFLESCVPFPLMDDAIDRIIYEELSALFEGDKTPEEVSEIMQSRVWLYLKESE